MFQFSCPKVQAALRQIKNLAHIFGEKRLRFKYQAKCFDVLYPKLHRHHLGDATTLGHNNIDPMLFSNKSDSRKHWKKTMQEITCFAPHLLLDFLSSLVQLPQIVNPNRQFPRSYMCRKQTQQVLRKETTLI